MKNKKIVKKIVIEIGTKELLDLLFSESGSTLCGTRDISRSSKSKIHYIQIVHKGGEFLQNFKELFRLRKIA